MDKTPATEAIALLIDLAQKGEIDPWDVQVIDVIDRFLHELEINSQINREADLSRSGQAFLWASMLVLFKADTLEQSETETIETEIEEIIDLENENSKASFPISLENYLRRRPASPSTKKRRVTLEELIEQLQQMAAELEAKPSPPAQRRQTISRRENIRLITDLAHNENLTEMAGQLDNFLSIYFNSLTNGNDWLDLDTLLENWHSINGFSHNHEQENQTSDKVGIFWALLLLSSQSKVELSQEEFYQDLSIKHFSLSFQQSA